MFFLSPPFPIWSAVRYGICTYIYIPTYIADIGIYVFLLLCELSSVCATVFVYYALMRWVSICVLCPVVPRPQDPQASGDSFYFILFFLFNYENWIFMCDEEVEARMCCSSSSCHSAANRLRSVCLSAVWEPVLYWLNLGLYFFTMFFFGSSLNWVNSGR